MTVLRRSLFNRIFPRAIGGTLQEFLFGGPCPRCNDGAFPQRSNRFDGTGSWRMHRVWVGPDHDPWNDYDSAFCYRNGWFARHWFATALIVLVIGLSILTGINVALAADTDLPPGYSCADVRAAVEKYGRPKAIRLAKRNGATREQIAAAEKCL